MRRSVRHVSLRVVAAFAAAFLAAKTGKAGSDEVNLLPNPSFELAEPPPPTATTKGQIAPAEKWLPRTWFIYAMDFAGYSLLDDPTQTHSGKRCVRVQSQGEAVILRY